MCSTVLKETLSYYNRNNTTTFCSFLDATKAFDRVNYCKLFRLLIERGIPACFVRILIKLYTCHSVRVSWAGFASDYFTAINGVKQGGVLSPVLFCIYIDTLLIRLSKCGVGCFIGNFFVGALAYADDIVLIAPTPGAMRKLLSVCDDFASEFDIVFNASKSKFLVIVPYKKHYLNDILLKCKFSIGGNPVEFVESFAHLGHIINSKLDDSDDIINRRNSFIGQSNNILCYFNKLDMLVKIKLFKSYCTSLYGCELWALNNNLVEEFCIAWRKALRRVLGLPYNCYSYLLPLLSNSLPAFIEICKRSVHFVSSCLVSKSNLVRFVSWHGIAIVRYRSCIGSNALACCKYFNWRSDEFLLDNIDLCNDFFVEFADKLLSFEDFNNACSLFEVLCIR